MYFDTGQARESLETLLRRLKEEVLWESLVEVSHVKVICSRYITLIR